MEIFTSALTFESNWNSPTYVCIYKQEHEHVIQNYKSFIRYSIRYIDAKLSGQNGVLHSIQHSQDNIGRGLQPRKLWE